MLDSKARGTRSFVAAASSEDIQGALALPRFVQGAGVDVALDMPSLGLGLSFRDGLQRVALRLAPQGLRGHSLVLRGEARRRSHTQRELRNATFAPNQLSMIGAHAGYDCENTHGQPQAVHCIYLEPAWLHSVASAWCGQRIQHVDLDSQLLFQDPVLLGVAARFVHQQTLPADELLNDCLRHLLGATLLARHASGLPAKRTRARPLAWRELLLINEAVQDQLFNSPRLADMARLGGLSDHQFLRCFHLSVGMTPHQFVMAKKLAAAEGLLRRSRLTIEQVAAATGFASQSHLTYALRRKTGLTPASLRLQTGGRAKAPAAVLAVT
jgi:AraC-like DNA-binding protein